MRRASYRKDCTNIPTRYPPVHPVPISLAYVLAAAVRMCSCFRIPRPSTMSMSLYPTNRHRSHEIAYTPAGSSHIKFTIRRMILGTNQIKNSRINLILFFFYFYCFIHNIVPGKTMHVLPREAKMLVFCTTIYNMKCLMLLK